MRVTRHGVLVDFGAAGLLLLSTLGYVASAIYRADGPPMFWGAMGQFIPTQESSPAPSIPILDAKGSTLHLSDFRGKVVLLNFWATWCAPCVREMPSLDRLQAEMGSDNFMVLALSIDREGLEVVTPFFNQLGLKSLAVFLDPKGAMSSSFRVRGLPTSYVIDHRGRIAGKLEGPAEWDTDEAKTLMRYYIERIGDEIDKTDATDFGADMAGARRPEVKALLAPVSNESARKIWLERLPNSGGRNDT